jgi:hypothetical protein
VLLQSSNGGDLSGFFIPQMPTSDTITVGAPPNQETFAYSFMTVSGGSPRQGDPPVGVTSFDRNTPPQGVFIGDNGATAVNVLMVYVPTGGGGPGGPGSGATIDEFDLTTGLLLNDTFVTVEPDPTGALTNSANVDGFVDTTNSGEAISALPTTAPSGVDFVGWATLGPPAHLDPPPILNVGQGQSVEALAFYQEPNLGTVTGTVSLDTNQGIDVVSGATVSDHRGRETTTGDDGTYVLRLPPGPVDLTASVLAARTPETKTVTVVAGQTVTVDFLLEGATM